MTYVLLHGWGGSKNSMEPLVKLLEQNGNEAVAFDLLGFGSESNPPADWGIEEYADFVEDKISMVMSKVQKPKSKVTLIGHSFGGAISLKIASKNPVWLAKIVVIAPSWKRASYESRIKNHKWRSSIKKLIPNSIKKMIYRLFFRRSDLYLRPDLESNYRKIVTQDLSEEIKKIHLPTLILWGENDAYVPVNHGELLQNNILDSKFKILPDGRHGLPFQNPQWIVEQMKKYGFL